MAISHQSVQSGNWNDPNTWIDPATNSPVSAAPAAGSTVYIMRNHKITVDAAGPICEGIWTQSPTNPGVMLECPFDLVVNGEFKPYNCTATLGAATLTAGQVSLDLNGTVARTTGRIVAERLWVSRDTTHEIKAGDEVNDRIVLVATHGRACGRLRYIQNAGGSSGISLNNDDPGAFHISVDSDPAKNARITAEFDETVSTGWCWAYRWKGNHTAALRSKAAGGQVVVSFKGVQFDADTHILFEASDGYTYVGYHTARYTVDSLVGGRAGDPNLSDWQDSGFHVSKGALLQISATGMARCHPNGMDLGPEGGANLPTGPDFLEPSLTEFALIGKIGVGGAPFKVGDRYAQTAASSGRLYLAYNDSYAPDNSGSFDVRIVG